jgi:flagellar hook-associated protein 3 FlgL
MRITNSMMTNSTLVNISRNMRYLDKLIQQIESTKKINVPSDDPIVASRALKFRTSVAETEQFQRNVQSGLAWMNVTESSFTNVVENLLQQIRVRFVEAATGTETGEDKMAIVAELRQFVEEIGLHMNQSYAGRYVFSGFRTDQPPVFNDDNTYSYYIEQIFTGADIEKTKSYQKVVTTPPELTNTPIVHDINILKLPYKDVTNVFVNGNPPITVPISESNAYTPAPGTIHYIPETGELVLSEDMANTLTASSDPIEVSYEKTNFSKGELNPQVYFTCRDLLNDREYNMDNQEIRYEFATNTFVTINSLAKNVFTDKMYADMLRVCEFAESLKLSDPKLLEEKYSGGTYNLIGEDLTNAINEQLTAEKAELQAVLYDRFNNMLYLTDRHAENAMKEHTSLGARANRLELLQARLEQDEVSYTQLLSDNEDTDLVKAIVLKSAAEAAYLASLKVGANIVQMTLANFIG